MSLFCVRKSIYQIEKTHVDHRQIRSGGEKKERHNKAEVEVSYYLKYGQESTHDA